MAKKIILIDETVSIPLNLLDKKEDNKPFTLDPAGICSDITAESLVKTYPLKYAFFDEKNAKHTELLKKGKYPEAKKVLDATLNYEFSQLSRENKAKVIEFIKGLK